MTLLVKIPVAGGTSLLPARKKLIPRKTYRYISKSGRPATMKTPIQRLFPLEYLINVKQPQEEQRIEGVRPPRRLAAQNADCTDQ